MLCIRSSYRNHYCCTVRLLVNMLEIRSGISIGDHGRTYQKLLSTRCRSLHQEYLRAAVVDSANAIFQTYFPHIWGKGTPACASNSTQFGVWGQSLLTKWYLRYGGKGIIVSWHVEWRVTSQFKICSSSKVAAVINGVLCRCTQMKVEKQFVDTCGQNGVALGFCFTKAGVKHPNYRAFAELGRAVKTIFLCQYVQAEKLKRETHEGLNVIENWNGANSFIFYKRSVDFVTHRLDDQELTVLSLHQENLVYVNLSLIQQALADPKRLRRMKKEDLWALTPLIYANVTSHRVFHLDFSECISIEEALSAPQWLFS